MNYLPFLIFALLVVGMLVLSGRNRRRTALAEADRAERIDVGTDVMTTSGLHGTVVGRNDDGTVTLSIAPGVEVRWELAALRDVTELPARYVHDDVPGGPAEAGREAGVDLDKRSGSDPAA